MNIVVLQGRLTRDPEVKYTSGHDGQMAIARYTLAVDRRNGKEADFISCVAFGKLGEFAGKYMKKGRKFTVSGRIQTGSYTNKDGVKVYTTDVIVDNQEFADAKQETQATARPVPADEFVAIPDDIEEGLPFK